MKSKRTLFFILVGFCLTILLAACSAEATPTEPGPEPAATATPPGERATSLPEPTSNASPEPESTPQATQTPGGTPQPTPALELVDPKTFTPTFELTSCNFEVPFGQTARCGYLTVPENRAKEATRLIKLHVAIFSSKNPGTQPDPLVYLAGGPGSNALEASLYNFRAFEPLLFNRDFIMLDQRGVGVSQPALDCPEYLELGVSWLSQNLDYAAASEQMTNILGQCSTWFKNNGIDVTAYNSTESAADLAALRVALGYEEWNLLGITYGARLAMTIMRDHPEGLRSVILDSPIPLEVDEYIQLPANAARAFDTLFQGCAEDDVCNSAFPNLSETLFNLVDRLNAAPIPLNVVHPLRNTTYIASFSGDDLLDVLYNAMYSTELIRSLPRAIFTADQGLYDTFAQLAGFFLIDRELQSHGMHYSVMCREELGFSTEDKFTQAVDEFSRLRGLFITHQANYRVCNGWGAGIASPIETLPIVSDIPALILSGEYDPVTPPAYGDQVASSLENSFFYTFPGTGHGVITSGTCAILLARSFLDNPEQTPDSSCLAGLTGPAFEGPLSSIPLEPFSEPQYRISGLAPVGWEKIAPGTWAKLNVGLAQASSTNLSGRDLLQSVLLQLNAQQVTEPAATRPTQTLLWSLYESQSQGVQVDVAITENRDGAYVIILQSPPSDRDFYYQNLFLPVIDAFKQE